MPARGRKRIAIDLRRRLSSNVAPGGGPENGFKTGLVPRHHAAAEAGETSPCTPTARAGSHDLHGTCRVRRRDSAGPSNKLDSQAGRPGLDWIIDHEFRFV